MVRSVVLMAVVLSAVTAQEDVIHYKFEGGNGDKVLNLAGSSPIAPGFGQVRTYGAATASQMWGTGKFGGGFANTTWGDIDTGWDMVVSPGQGLTVAFFYKVDVPVPMSNVVRVCGPIGNSNGLTMRIRGDNGYPWMDVGANYTLAYDVLTPALTAWVHVAFVFEVTPTASIVHWYVDGNPQPFQVVSSPLHLQGSSSAPLIWSEGYFRYDEVRISRRAVPAAEILDWATLDGAANSPFGDACVPFGQVVALDNVSGSLPTIGNASYELTLFAPYGALAALVVGLDRATPQGLGFVNGALATCSLYPSIDLQLPVVTMPPTGRVGFPFPIPSDPSFVGFSAYGQAVGLNPWTSDWFTSNAFAVAVGN